MIKLLRKFLSWGVATALMGYMLYTIPLEELSQALRRANISYLIGTVFFVDIGCLIADTWATSRIITWFLVPVRFMELLPVRAASYLMAILNYNLGQAGLVYYFHRVKGVPLLAATAMILMMMGTVVLMLSLMSLGGMAIASDERTRQFGLVVASLGAGAVIYFIILRARPAWLARRGLFKPLFDVGVLGHLKATLVRVPHMAVIIIAHVLGMHSFGIEVPLGAGLIFIPMVLLVAALPLTPFGLGTMQVTAIHFFYPYAAAPTVEAQKAMVFAYSLSLASLALALQGLMGLLCFRHVSAMGIFDRGDDGSPKGG